MRIWIDTDSGTWGAVETLRICDVDDEGCDVLDIASDSERNDFGLRFGRKVRDDNRLETA